MASDKVIVTTTINAPTKALIKYSKMKDWKLIVVADLNTPHEEYKNINCIYLSPEEQEKKYPLLSQLIGWNTIARRNIGLLEAYRMKSSIMATVDDDNIPYDTWGENVVVNKTILVDTYDSDEIFDPLSVTEYNYLWHRGYPVELLKHKNNIRYIGKQERKVLVQADFWDGDPDIDAICRITYKPNVKFKFNKFFASIKTSPFNCQNTFISRDVIPYYFMHPYIGRMDDIWASYYVQANFPNSVVYGPASVFHDRNFHNLANDIKLEMLGYENGYEFVQDPIGYTNNKLPEKAILARKEYDRLIKGMEQ